MSKPKLTIFFVLTVALAISAAAQPPSSNTAELPPGPEQSKARVACATCHDPHIIVQQRLSKAAWGKEVDKMIKWGAIVEPADRDALVEYLSTNFAPDKPVYVAQRLSKKH